MKNLEIGYEFVARKTYPFADKGRKPINKDESSDIRVGEKAKIIDVDSKNNTFKILNLSLNSENAWFVLTEDELLKLQRKGNYK